MDIPYPGGPTGLALLGAAGIALAVVAGALPPLIAAAVIVALPAVVLTLLVPRAGLVLLVFSIPLSGWTSISAGNFSISSTDVIVALLILGWALRGIAARRLVVHSGPTIVALGLLFASAWLSTLTAIDFPDALKELIKLAEMIAVALYASSELEEEKEQRFVVLVLLAAGVLESLQGFRQFVTRSGPEFFTLGSFLRAYGDFGQPNALAGYLGMILPFGIALSFRGPRENRLILVATAIIAAGIAATWSRGAWLGSIAGLSVMALLWSERTRRWLALGAGTAVIIGVLGLAGLLPTVFAERFSVLFENFVVFDASKVDPTPTNWSLVERMAHWQAGWDMARDHPLLGVGPGNYEAAYPRYYIGDWIEALGHSHNYYINTFAELGVVGIVIFLGFTVTIFVRFISAAKRAGASQSVWRAVLVATVGSVVTLSVHNTFDNMLVHGIGVQLGLILGLAEAAARRVEPTGA